MPFHQTGSVRYYTFPLLDAAGVQHAVFTRQGGVSPAPWSALNMGSTVGDELARVQENRRRAFQALGRSAESMYDVWQVHGREVVCTHAARSPGTPHLQADGILTDRPEVTLFMRFADCVPVLLYDPQRKVAGLVHAGWQGTVKKAAAAAVEQMQRQYGSQPADLLAGIGPSIGAHHYQVGAEVVQQVQAAFGPQADTLLFTADNSTGVEQTGVQFDLWGANQVVLEQAGVLQVEVAGLCTACQLEDWYSHRAEKGRTGRFGALICV